MQGSDLEFEVPMFEEESAPLKVYNGVDFSRQMGLFNPFEYKNIMITVIGAGAIGSMIALVLAKQGYRNISVWDDDVVSPENLPNQFYPIASVGQKKVDALKDVVKMFTGCELTVHDIRWEEGLYIKEMEKFKNECSPVPGKGGFSVIIMATDNMASRKEVFEKRIKAYRYMPGGDDLFIDARMGGLAYRIFMQDYTGLDLNMQYPLYTDEQASTEPCTQKSIIFNVTSIASTVAAWLYNYLKSYMGRNANVNSMDAWKKVYGSGEVLGDMVNMRVCDGMDITKLM